MNLLHRIVAIALSVSLVADSLFAVVAFSPRAPIRPALLSECLFSQETLSLAGGGTVMPLIANARIETTQRRPNRTNTSSGNSVSSSTSESLEENLRAIADPLRTPLIQMFRLCFMRLITGIGPTLNDRSQGDPRTMLIHAFIVYTLPMVIRHAVRGWSARPLERMLLRIVTNAGELPAKFVVRYIQVLCAPTVWYEDFSTFSRAELELSSDRVKLRALPETPVDGIVLKQTAKRLLTLLYKHPTRPAQSLKRANGSVQTAPTVNMVDRSLGVDTLPSSVRRLAPGKGSDDPGFAIERRLVLTVDNGATTPTGHGNLNPTPPFAIPMRLLVIALGESQESLRKLLPSTLSLELHNQQRDAVRRLAYQFRQGDTQALKEAQQFLLDVHEGKTSNLNGLREPALQLAACIEGAFRKGGAMERRSWLKLLATAAVGQPALSILPAASVFIPATGRYEPGFLSKIGEWNYLWNIFIGPDRGPMGSDADLNAISMSVINSAQRPLEEWRIILKQSLKKAVDIMNPGPFNTSYAADLNALIVVQSATTNAMVAEAMNEALTHPFFRQVSELPREVGLGIDHSVKIALELDLRKRIHRLIEESGYGGGIDSGAAHRIIRRALRDLDIQDFAKKSHQRYVEPHQKEIDEARRIHREREKARLERLHRRVEDILRNLAVGPFHFHGEMNYWRSLTCLVYRWSLPGDPYFNTVVDLFLYDDHEEVRVFRVQEGLEKMVDRLVDTARQALRQHRALVRAA